MTQTVANFATNSNKDHRDASSNEPATFLLSTESGTKPEEAEHVLPAPASTLPPTSTPSLLLLLVYS